MFETEFFDGILRTMITQVKPHCPFDQNLLERVENETQIKKLKAKKKLKTI